MNKKELVEALAKKTALSQKQVTEVLAAFTAAVTDELKKKDGKVQLVGFGTFAVAERPARTGRNPRTGKAIKVKAAKVPKFKAGKALKDAVNKAKKK